MKLTGKAEESSSTNGWCVKLKVGKSSFFLFSFITKPNPEKNANFFFVTETTRKLTLFKGFNFYNESKLTNDTVA